MTRLGTLLTLAIVALSSAACSQAPQTAAEPPLYAPAALLVQTADARAISPYQVLPASDPEYCFIPRGDKFLYGAITEDEVSSYSVLIYDSQRISSPREGSGYRYTWAVRQGISFP